MKPNSKTNIEQLAEWIDEWQEQLFRYAFYRVGSRSDAEDIVQDAFLKIFSTQNSIANPKAYLYRIVSNGCVDLLRHKSKLKPLEERMPTPPQSEEMEPVFAIARTLCANAAHWNALALEQAALQTEEDVAVTAVDLSPEGELSFWLGNEDDPEAVCLSATLDGGFLSVEA